MPQPPEVTMDDLYASLDVEARIVVQQRTSEIKTLMRRTAQDIIEIGQKLIEVKAKLGHGPFGAWLQVEFEWTDRTARRFMSVAEVFKSDTVSVLANVDAKALYLLATPSAPESAREEALLRAEEGEQITHHVAQEIVAAHRTAPTPSRQGVMAEMPSPDDEESRSSGRHLTTDLDQRHSPVTLAWDAPERPSVTGAVTTAPVAVSHKMAVHFSSQTVEHYTPEAIIAPTLTCLGEIDLDPCSDGGDPPNVPAHAHYTATDDGLAHSWHGRIYLNPPYGREIGDWVEKLCSEHEAGQVTEAIALLPSRTDTQWWKRLRAYPVCFVQGRLTFVGSEDPAPFPSAVFYLGQDIARFCRAFGHLGDIYQRIEIEEQP